MGPGLVAGRSFFFVCKCGASRLCLNCAPQTIRLHFLPPPAWPNTPNSSSHQYPPILFANHPPSWVTLGNIYRVPNSQLLPSSWCVLPCLSDLYANCSHIVGPDQKKSFCGTSEEGTGFCLLTALEGRQNKSEHRF